MAARRVRGTEKGTFAHKYLLAFSNWVSVEFIIFSFEIQTETKTPLVSVTWTFEWSMQTMSLHFRARVDQRTLWGEISWKIFKLAEERHRAVEESSYRKIKESRKRFQSKSRHFLGLLWQQV